MANCWVFFPPTKRTRSSPISHPPSPLSNLCVQSETAIIDKRCIAGKIVNFHCVPDEQRWRIAGFSFRQHGGRGYAGGKIPDALAGNRRIAIRHHSSKFFMYNQKQLSLISDVSLAKL